MMSGRRHLIVVLPPPSDEDHRTVRSPPRRAKADGTVQWLVRKHDCGSNILLFESFAEYEREGQDDDDYQHRMVANFLVFVVTLALIAAGVWLAANTL
jgi:hypothetical protein